MRVALAKAVDWTEINDKLYYDTRTTATSFAPPTVAGGGEDVCGDDCTYDPAAAKALLEKAGGIPGNKVQVAGLANSENEAAKAECNMIQKNLGVECDRQDLRGLRLDARRVQQARRRTTRASSSASAGVRTTRPWRT